MNPLVSVVIPCRNEARSIGRCLDSVLASEYPPEKLEVIVADGMSSDGTRESVAAYAARDSRVRPIDNPAGVTPAALNRAIESARGDVILRLDARSEISPEYIARAVKHLDGWGADCVGGAMQTLAEGPGKFARPIGIALTHSFGVGNAHFRTGSGAPRWVDTVYGACWRREVFDRVGWFNERLARSQDIEFSSHLRRAGGKILLTPDMRIRYYVGGTLRGFWRRNWTNGMWALLPLACSPGMAVRWRHLAPLGFVTALTGSLAVAAWTGTGWLAAAAAGPYIAMNVAASAHAAWKERRASLLLRMPVVFASLHLAYGTGSVWGCVRLVLAFSKQTAREAGIAL